MSDETVTVQIPKDDLRYIEQHLRLDTQSHGRHCGYRTWYGGECTCWIRDARKALDAKDPPPVEGAKP